VDLFELWENAFGASVVNKFLPTATLSASLAPFSINSLRFMLMSSLLHPGHFTSKL
jgi:hypothetical protein